MRAVAIVLGVISMVDRRLILLRGFKVPTAVDDSGLVIRGLFERLIHEVLKGFKSLFLV